MGILRRILGLLDRFEKCVVVFLVGLMMLTVALALGASAQPDPNWLAHDRSRPQPPKCWPISLPTLT